MYVDIDGYNLYLEHCTCKDMSVDIRRAIRGTRLQSVMPLFVSHVTRVEGYRRNAVTLSVLSLFLNFSGRHIIDTLLDYFTCHVRNKESGLRLPKS